VLDVELRAPPQLGRRGDLIVGQIGQMHLADHLRGGLLVADGRRRTDPKSRGLDECRRHIEVVVARLDDDAHRGFLVEANIDAECRPLATIGKVEHRRNRRRVVINNDRDGVDLAPIDQRRLNRDRHKPLIESPVGCLEADGTLTASIGRVPNRSARISSHAERATPAPESMVTPMRIPNPNN
jgi:hypothetical protein